MNRHTISARPGGTLFRIEVSSSLARFADIWPTTTKRGDARCYPFQCSDVLGIWCETIGRSRGVEPLFATVRLIDGTPVLLLPLGIERRGGVRILGFLDAGVSDYNAPIVFPAAAEARLEADCLWKQIQSHLPPFDLAVLEKMPQAVEDLSNPLTALSAVPRHESCHHITLDGDWAEFSTNRLPNPRDSRRRLRKLKERATIRFDIAQTHEERMQIFDALIRMKRQRFAATTAYDIFADAGYLDFYAQATRQLGPRGSVQVSALYAGDQIVAANWGFITGSRYFDLLPSYEGGEWRSFAPGRLLSEWLLQQHLERGDKIFDYGIGDEPYKFGYCNQSTELGDACIPVTIKGAAFAQLFRLQVAAKSKLRDTRMASALKVARNLLSRVGQNRNTSSSGDTLPAWIALIGSVTLAVDA